MQKYKQRLESLNGIKCNNCGKTYNAKKAVVCYDDSGKYIGSYSHCNYCRKPVLEKVMDYDEN